jgi:glycogen(starch) synthase
MPGRSLGVCLVSREFPPFVGGGIGSYTLRFARALAAAGHRPVVVTVSRDGQTRREADDGVTIVRLPFIAGDDWSAPHPRIRTPQTLALFRDCHPVSVVALMAARALPGLVEEEGIDVIEAPDCGALSWFILRDRAGHAGLSRVPVVCVLHSPTAWIEHWNGWRDRSVRGSALRKMEQDSLRAADALVCPTKSLAAWSRRHLGLGEIEVVPLPLGELEGAAQASAAGDVPGAGSTILYAGRLEPRKGVDTLLEAFDALAARGVDARLVLAGRDTRDERTGEPFGRRRVERMRPAARERVELAGEMPPDRLAALRRIIPFAAAPAPMDNFPYACVEAMAHGQVVVGARAGGMAEMIRQEEDGLLFAPGDAGACADALEAALGLDARRRRELAVSGARRILSLCANDAVVSARVEHFRAVMSRPRRAAPAPMRLPRPSLRVRLARRRARLVQVLRPEAGARTAP